jgi:hypothetical protein
LSTIVRIVCKEAKKNSSIAAMINDCKKKAGNGKLIERSSSKNKYYSGI